jgi:hypothetical protein
MPRICGSFEESGFRTLRHDEFVNPGDFRAFLRIWVRQEARRDFGEGIAPVLNKTAIGIRAMTIQVRGLGSCSCEMAVLRNHGFGELFDDGCRCKAGQAACFRLKCA